MKSYLIIENLFLWARSRSNCFAGKYGERYWSTGVLEKEEALNSSWISPFITPLLHHSIDPADSHMT
jgi:hypothetical protein